MNESISRAAGAEHGQELPPERMEALIRSAGPSAAAADDDLRHAARRAGSPLVRGAAARGAAQPAGADAGLRRPAKLLRPAALAI